MRQIILVGAVGQTLKSEWREYTKSPQAPSNYKDPEKIENWIQTKTQELESRVLNETGVLTDFREIQVAARRLLTVECGSKNLVPSTMLMHGNILEDNDGVLTFLMALSDTVSDPSSGIIIGDNAKNIIRALFREPNVDNSCFKDVAEKDRQNVAHCYFLIRHGLYENTGIRFVTLDEFLFTREEREMLLTRKILNCETDYQKEPVAYMQEALQKFGYTGNWATAVISNG